MVNTHSIRLPIRVMTASPRSTPRAAIAPESPALRAISSPKCHSWRMSSRSIATIPNREALERSITSSMKFIRGRVPEFRLLVRGGQLVRQLFASQFRSRRRNSCFSSKAALSGILAAAGRPWVTVLGDPVTHVERPRGRWRRLTRPDRRRRFDGQMSLRSVRLVLFATAALLLTPSAASAAWTVSPTPNVAGATDTSLNAVDCTSANSCMAVGGTISARHTGLSTIVTYSTVAEHWDGTSWKIVPTPDPFSSTPISLNGVSCPRPNVCFAVGSSANRPRRR